MFNGQPHALIISPKNEGEFTDVKWHNERERIESADSYIDGLGNTDAMAKAGSELAERILALTIDGHSDWALPARDQLELIYRVAKPTERENLCTFRDGENPSDIPATYPYTPQSPSQTTDKAFQEDGEEALEPDWYWASIQHSADCAWTQNFSCGFQYYNGKDCEARSRAVRMIPVIN